MEPCQRGTKVINTGVPEDPSNRSIAAGIRALWKGAPEDPPQEDRLWPLEARRGSLLHSFSCRGCRWCCCNTESSMRQDYGACYRIGRGESEASPILNSMRVDLAQNPLADVSTRHAQEVEERALALLASSDVMSCTTIDAPEGPKRRLCSCKKSEGQQGGAVCVATAILSPAAFIGPRSEEGESHENIPIERSSEPSPGRLEGSEEGSELENSELIDQRLDLPKSSPNVDSKLHSTGPVVPKAAPAPELSLQRLSTISLVEDECISELVLPPQAHPFLLHKANTGLGFALQVTMDSSISRLCGESYI